jgi:hypothetical protein
MRLAHSLLSTCGPTGNCGTDEGFDNILDKTRDIISALHATLLYVLCLVNLASRHDALYIFTLLGYHTSTCLRKYNVENRTCFTSKSLSVGLLYKLTLYLNTKYATLL